MTELDPAFEAPEHLFAIWADKYQAGSTRLDSPWMQPPALTAGMTAGTTTAQKLDRTDTAVAAPPLRPLQPRGTPSQWVQCKVLLTRTFRQHSTSGFLSTLALVAFAAVLLATVGKPDTYSYLHLCVRQAASTSFQPFPPPPFPPLFQPFFPLFWGPLWTIQNNGPPSSRAFLSSI